MTVNRRKFIAKAATLAASLPVFSVLAPTLGWGGHPSTSGGASPTPPTEPQVIIPIDELMKPGPLGEMSEGSEHAQVTVVEYASMTCPFCAAFHKNVYPQLKEKYIDTGKVRLVMREFPLDRLALAAVMITRCADKSQFFPLTDILYKQQSVWARSKDPATELFKIAKLAGFTEEKFNTCLNNKEIAQGVLDVMNKGRDQFQVTSTPTFFINGTKVAGTSSFKDFEKLILQHLNS